MQIQNPFESINSRLTNIESILLDLKQRKQLSIPQPSTPDLLTISEAASLLHLSVPTCYSKVSKRELPHTKKGGRLYFSRQELMIWLKQGRRKTKMELEQEANDYVALK